MAAASSQVSARFCYMFASPLVRKTNGQFIPIARPLNLEREQTDLINKLKDSGKRVAWEQHVTSHETFASALPAKIDVLHYSGHGEPGELCGEDSLGVLTEITVKQVGDFLRLLQQRGPLPLVFVSACHSFNIGSVFMQAGSPHVVCINAKDQVMDNAALSFAKVFYGLLLEHGLSVATAFMAARQALAGKFAAAEVDKFLLLPEPSAACGQRFSEKWVAELERLHSRVIFPSTPAGVFHRAGRVTPGKVPHASQLTGRDLTLHTLYNCMVRASYKCSFVNIHGQPGVGKAALATCLAQYAYERTELNGFRGVYFFDAAELARTVHRPRSSHGRSETSPSIIERVVEEIADMVGLEDAATLPQRGLRHAADKLGSKLAGSLLVLTHCDTEGRHGMPTEVMQDIQEVAEVLLGRLVKAHRCSLVITSREPLGQDWQLGDQHHEHLQGLSAEHAGEFMLVQWQMHSQASRTLHPSEWGLHIPYNRLKMVPQREQKREYFKLAGQSQLLRALQCNPRAILEWVQAAKGRTPAAHHPQLLMEAGRVLQRLGLRLDAQVLGQDVVDQLEAASPATPFSPEPPSAGGQPSELLRTASAPLRAAPDMPNSPSMRGSTSAVGALSSSTGVAGAGGGASTHSQHQQPLRQSFVPGGLSPNLRIPVSRTDYEMVQNQHELDAPYLWSAWLSMLQMPQNADSIQITPRGPREHETPGGACLRFLIKEYVQARLPTIMAQRGLQDSDISTMVGWLLKFAQSSSPAGGSFLKQSLLENALQSTFIPWLGMMKSKLLSMWTQYPPGSTLPSLQGFLDPDQALHLLQSAGAAMGTYLWRFSASRSSSITASVLTVGNMQQHVCWNCRLTLTQLPAGATAYSARDVSCPPSTLVWQYEWPKVSGALYVHELEDFAHRHREMFRELLIGKSSSTYEERAVVGLLQGVGGGHSPSPANIPERPAVGMQRAHSGSSANHTHSRPPQFM